MWRDCMILRVKPPCEGTVDGAMKGAYKPRGGVSTISHCRAHYKRDEMSWGWKGTERDSRWG